MSSNATWVCFDCREAVRRPTWHVPGVPCPRCGRACRGIGHRLRVPARGDDRAWRRLRETLRDRRRAEVDRVGLAVVRGRHELERQLAELESRPANDGRARAIRVLRSRLGPA